MPCYVFFGLKFIFVNGKNLLIFKYENFREIYEYSQLTFENDKENWYVPGKEKIKRENLVMKIGIGEPKIHLTPN